jgi:hypothetical protein
MDYESAYESCTKYVTWFSNYETFPEAETCILCITDKFNTYEIYVNMQIVSFEKKNNFCHKWY